MAGITIDLFPLLGGNGIIQDTDWLPVGRNDTTYHTPIPEALRLIQKNLSDIPNNPLGPQTQIINGGFIATVATGALTVALRTTNGDEPSASDPVYIIFRHGTLTNSGYTIRKITSALSYTLASGATLGVPTSLINTELLLVGINDVAGMQIGLVNPRLSGGNFFVVDEWSLKSTTGGTGGNNSGVIYSSTTLTNKPIAILSVLRWNSGLSSPGTWTVPDSVQSINSSVNISRLYESINDALAKYATLAPLASPGLTGVPTAPTAGVNTNNTQIATTAFVLAQAATATPIINGIAAVGVATRFAREDHVHPIDTSRAPTVSPTFTGTPVAPTASQDNNTTQVATTAYVLGQAGSATPLVDGTASAGISTRFSRQDHVHPTDTSRAATVSPTFTGTPAAPTASVDTNSTQIATTAFVLAQAGSATPIMDGIATVGTSTRFSRQDHIHPTDTTRAPVNSPTFTGTPNAPTAAVDTNNTQIATTAYVIGQGYVKSVSPAFSGTPTAPTAANGTNTTQLATTAFVNNAVSAAGNYNPAAVVITGGSINNTTIGATTATTGVFTALSCTAPNADDNSSRVPTTAWYVGQKGTTNPIADGAATPGTSSKWSPIDHVHPTDTSRAPLNSPTFTGTPVAPTASVGTNNTQIATTAYVIGQAGTATPLVDGSATVGSSGKYAREDHVHPTDTSRAPLASPAITGNMSVTGSINVSGEAQFYIGKPNGNVGVNFDSGDFLAYDRTNNQFNFFVGGVIKGAINGSGQITAIGSINAYNDSELYLGKPGGNPGINFDSNDWMAYNRTSNSYEWYVGGNRTLLLDNVGSLRASANVHASNDSELYLGKPNGSPGMVLDNNDYFIYDRTNNVYHWLIGAAIKMTLDAAGNFSVTGSLSDARLKDNIVEFSDAFKVLDGIKTYNFTWNEESEKTGKTKGKKDFGILAREVKAVLPDAVIPMRMTMEDDSPEYDTINFSRLVPVLISAAKELKQENDDLRAELNELKSILKQKNII